jgi:undecaprenyl-diphosphatase
MNYWSPVTVAVSLLLGGIVLLKVDQWFNQRTLKNNLSDGIQNRIYQCLAMVPWFLEVAPALWVECLKKLTTSVAEFSFFLAVLLCLAQRQKKMLRLLQDGFVLTHDQINLLIIGNVIALSWLFSH